jgi:hypothetical protein
MQAIHVRRLPWGNTYPARYIATAAAGKVIVKVGQIPDGVDHYRYAAEQLCYKFGWDAYGDMLSGTLADGSQVFVFDHHLSRKEPA